MLGAVAGPFLLCSLVRKAIEHRSAFPECAALSVFGLVLCLWLLSVFSVLPTA